MTDIALEDIAGRSPDWAAPAAGSIRHRSLSGDVLSGAAAYRRLAQDWERLAALQPGPVPFQSPALLEVWSRHFAADPASLLTTVVVRREDGVPVLIWPLVIERKGLLRVARTAGTPVGQYDEMLLDPGCDPREAWEVARETLMRTARPDLLLLERVRADGALHAALAGAEPLGSGEGAPYADLTGGVAKLMASLKPRVVKQQKKRVRRFEEEGEVRLEVSEGPEQAEAWLAEAMELKREWLRSTGRFSRAFLKAETAECLGDLARSLASAEASPRLVVSRLTLDGRVAAVEMGFCHRGTYHLYLGAFAPDLARFGPGNVLTERLLHWCAANGITRYDMLAPRSRNKSEWQSGEVEVGDFALPVTWRGRLYAEGVLRRLLPTARRAFYALPDRMRTTLAGVALRRLGHEAPAAGGPARDGDAP